MAHWFHRNPLKATLPVTFDLKGALTTNEASKIASDLRLSRVELLELMLDPNNELQTVEEAVVKYLSLMSALSLMRGRPLYDMTNPGTEAESKLRPLVRFSWSNSVLGLIPYEVNDAWFEVLSLCVNVALWFTKHAAKLSGKDEVKDEEAKEVHRCLRRAAGLFSFVTRSVSNLKEKSFDKGSDLDAGVLLAYSTQCTAEAQEVTVARAVELKHAPSLISALAYETSKLFQKADYEKAEALCVEYAKARGPGTTVRPQNHMFFRRLRPILDRTLGKCERENGMIYHQKVPAELPDLELKATFGLAAPEDFALPQAHDLWTPTAYAAFDIGKASMPDFTPLKKGSKELKAVKEMPVYQKDSDHNTLSGCSIS